MTDDDFGHDGRIIPGVACIDSWGAGPFIVEAGGKAYRFEDSDRFGPALVKRNGDLLANPYPGERSPFWRAHRLWVRQGRRLQPDGITCIWDEPRPTTYQKIGRTNFVVDNGEEDGAHIDITPAGIKALEGE